MAISVNNYIKRDRQIGITYDINNHELKGFSFAGTPNTYISPNFKFNPRTVVFPVVKYNAGRNHNGSLYSLSGGTTNTTYTEWSRSGTDAESDDYGLGILFPSLSTATTPEELSVNLGAIYYETMNLQFFPTAVYDELNDKTNDLTYEMKYDNDDSGYNLSDEPSNLWTALPNSASNWTTQIGQDGLTNADSPDYRPLGIYKLSNITSNLSGENALRLVLKAYSQKTSQGTSGSDSYLWLTYDDIEITIWNYVTQSWESTEYLKSYDTTTDINPHHHYSVIDVEISKYVQNDELYLKMRGSISESSDSGYWKNHRSYFNDYNIYATYAQPKRYF